VCGSGHARRRHHHHHHHHQQQQQQQQQGEQEEEEDEDEEKQMVFSTEVSKMSSSRDRRSEAVQRLVDLQHQSKHLSHLLAVKKQVDAWNYGRFALFAFRP